MNLKVIIGVHYEYKSKSKVIGVHYEYKTLNGKSTL